MKLFLYLGLILFPVVSYSAVYDCGKGAIAIISHPVVVNESVSIAGIGHLTDSGLLLTFPCYSSLSVSSSDSRDSVSVLPVGETTQELTYRQIASFFVGSFAAMAFVMASRSDV